MKEAQAAKVAASGFNIDVELATGVVKVDKKGIATDGVAAGTVDEGAAGEQKVTIQPPKQ
jgi:hypothetical protein